VLLSNPEERDVMKRFWLPALFLAAVGALTLNCGETTTGPGEAEGYYLGAEACKQCHSTAYKNESHTKHFNTFDEESTFFKSWKGAGKPDSCLLCHTTGWNTSEANHGADEVDYRKNLLGIQCESCHGPGSEHVKGGGDPNKITVDYSAKLCGSCHTGGHHPTYDEWKTSDHANALTSLKGSSHASDHCLACHSSDYWYDRTVTLETAKEGITCVMCHFAHGSNFEYQLREEGEKLCGLCHTSEGSQPPSSPHHPQDEMLLGIGGYEWPQGGPYRNTAHTYDIEERCMKCHMYTKGYESEENPAITGHSWKPNVEVCRECHKGTNNFNIHGAQTKIGNLMTTLKAKLDQQKNEEAPDYINAKFNHGFVGADASEGVHNFDYARQLLEDSIEFYTPSGDNVWPFAVAKKR
jgi:predicted CXXCH cytochrome family protein